ncbi:solute carrier family 2, facilitated glucose transporter member 2-like isoform X2 [Danaus plexippus]|nr:solute carrier family 2, facilitated glucose transporter member 2-like isoform X2 [Danaus plexippus]
MTYIGLSLVIIGMVLILFLKESPLYLMIKGLEKEAAKSIAYYKGLNLDSIEIISHLETLRQLITSDIKLNDIPEMESLNSEIKSPQQNLSILKFLRNSPSSRRALIILIVIFTTCIFQGLAIVQVFAQPLFATAVPSMSSTLSSVIFALTIVISGIFEAVLVEAIGRRMLLIVTSIVTGLLCIILGVKIQFQWGPGWLTAVLIYIYSSTFSFGAGAVPYVLTGEIFLPQIKSFASTVVFECSYFCTFLMLFMFNPLFNAFGLGPIFYIFAGSCFLTALVTFFFLPETKNLPVDVIQRKFLEKKLFK